MFSLEFMELQLTGLPTFRENDCISSGIPLIFCYVIGKMCIFSPVLSVTYLYWEVKMNKYFK